MSMQKCFAGWPGEANLLRGWVCSIASFLWLKGVEGATGKCCTRNNPAPLPLLQLRLLLSVLLPSISFPGLLITKGSSHKIVKTNELEAFLEARGQ